jgi:ABC-type Fe3+/spermidine/putrescine transport system ATPase subunit
MAILEISRISKSFAETRALQDISFVVDSGEIVALLGPSGCGKSTLLAIIAGLEAADHGQVLWEGQSLTNVQPHQRGFGLMFQDFSLFPHMNVYANIAFGLKMAHMDDAAIKQRVAEMLDLVGLADFARRDVNTLSGGEQQRIALARALAPHPRLLMLDDPLGSLDRNLRERLVFELQDILLRMHQTAIYVTHDQEEAFIIADKIILMNSGHIEQMGTPEEIYTAPASLFVASFLEMTNLIPAVVNKRDGHTEIVSQAGRFPFDTPLNGDVTLLIRPDTARLDNQGPVTIEGVLMNTSFRGSRQRATFMVDQISLIFEFPFSEVLPPSGTQMPISLTPQDSLRLFPPQ